MKKYDVDVTITVTLDDDTDEETAYDAVAEMMSRVPAAVATPGVPWTWTMPEGCVTEHPSLERLTALLAEMPPWGERR